MATETAEKTSKENQWDPIEAIFRERVKEEMKNAGRTGPITIRQALGFLVSERDVIGEDDGSEKHKLEKSMWDKYGGFEPII